MDGQARRSARVVSLLAGGAGCPVPRSPARNSATDSAVRDLLTTLGVRTREFFWCFAFSRRLDRLSRTYSQKTLEIACLDLIDLWEFRGLDPNVMRAVSLCVFGIVLPASRPEVADRVLLLGQVQGFSSGYPSRYTFARQASTKATFTYYVICKDHY
jgi:hypothetical protein